MLHWQLVPMGQAEKVLTEWTRRRIEVLEEVLPPDCLDRVNEAERARTEGTGGISPPPMGSTNVNSFGPGAPWIIWKMVGNSGTF